MEGKPCVAALALVTATPGLAQTPVPAPTTFDEAVAQIDANFDHWQSQAHAPGLIWGVVLNGQFRHARFTGRRNLDSQALNYRLIPDAP